MLHIRKVLGAKPKEHVVVELKQMLTPWGEALDAGHVLEEHPDPQLERASFQTLNGPWRCAFVQDGHDPAANLEQVVAEAATPADDAFDADIVVPFSPESLLSGVSRQLQPDELLWYRRTFATPDLGGGDRCILHFQAVDYACAVRVNGKLAGTHAGGYLPFSFDVTDALDDAENVLEVCVADPSEFGQGLRGKQRFDRGDIWYTAQSGIWQSVWMETVPAVHVESLVIDPDPRTGVLGLGVRLAGIDDANPPADLDLRVEVFDETGACAASAATPVAGETCALAVHVPNVHLWSPADPHLYHLQLRVGDDTVKSYCGFRSIEMREDGNGHARLFLNGEPLFIRGVLDQAYWSDGLMTAPADEALAFDIKAMHDAGFNLMRKHIKIESARWYYHCDRMGMLVLQDMVNGGGRDIQLWDWSYKPTLFKMSWNHFRDNTPKHRAKLGAGDAGYRDEWTRTCADTVRLLGNHPCIIGWSLFNEGWGQFDAREAHAMVRRLDPTRLVDAVSGWYDQGCGDFKSVHNYFRDFAVWRDRKHGRAFFVSEFGGYVHRVDGHSALDEAYGYEMYDDLDEWRASVRKLIDEVAALEPRGLVGFIYTQVSDIEEETNGILTYDRRVNKME